MLRATSAALAIALAASSPVLGRAQPQPDFEMTRHHYLNARDALSRKHFDAAVREYIQAYDVTREPKTAPGADEVRERLATMTDGAAPGQPPLSLPSPPLPPPSVPSPAERPTAVAQAAPATAPPGATNKAAASPGDAPAPSSPDMQLAQPPFPTSADGEGHWQRTAAWLAVGVAAVALTSGAVLATASLGRKEDIRQLIDYRDPVTGMRAEFSGSTKADYEDKIAEGQRLSSFATAAFVGAGVCAAAATVLFVLDARRASAAEKPAARLAPYLDGHGGGGVGAAWTF